MEYVFEFDAKHKKELEALLAADPYAEDSFARLGYSLKESHAIGLKGGFLVLCFSTNDEKLGQKLVEKVKTIPNRELSAEEKQKVVTAIKTEEDNAATGFGSIFS